MEEPKWNITSEQKWRTWNRTMYLGKDKPESLEVNYESELGNRQTFLFDIDPETKHLKPAGEQK